jgi:hypothetical protein
MLRLKTESQAAFVSHILALARGVDSENCKAMFLGKLSTAEAAALERKYVAGLPLEQFQSILNLYRDATVAELAAYPDVRTITPEQAALAEKVFDDSAKKRVLAAVPTDVLRRVGQDAAAAPAEEVCTTIVTYSESMLDLPEPYRSWKLTRFAESMQ